VDRLGRVIIGPTKSKTLEGVSASAHSENESTTITEGTTTEEIIEKPSAIEADTITTTTEGITDATSSSTTGPVSEDSSTSTEAVSTINHFLEESNMRRVREPSQGLASEDQGSSWGAYATYGGAALAVAAIIRFAISRSRR
jgi:hypothetical protein